MQRLFALFILVVGLPPISRAETVLIIPFFNISSTQNISWIGDSVSESIQESLASEGVLTVRQELRDQELKESGVKRYARLTRASVMEIGVSLDAAAVIYGDIQFAPAPQGATSKGTITLIARIINVRQLRRGAEFVETGQLEQLAALQTRLAWRILKEIRPAAQLSEEIYRQRHPAVRVEALESYVLGLLAQTDEQRIRLFSQAIRLEPAYARPAFHLGQITFNKKDFRAASEWLKQVTSADSNYREAQFLLATARYFQADFNSAIKLLTQLAEAAPLGEVENNLGAAKLRAARPEAFSHFLKAIEVDPADPAYQFNAGYAYWRLADFANAAQHFRATLERAPDDEQARLLLGRAEQKLGHRPGDPETDNLVRVKLSYDESAWQHLKAIFGAKQIPQ